MESKSTAQSIKGTLLQFKDSYEISSYIFILEKRNQRNVIFKIRLFSHDLKIETGRHNKTPRNITLCELCSLLDIEDEYHFTLICPFFKNIRSQYIAKYYVNHPSMYKFVVLLKTSRKRELTKLAVYFEKALRMRHNHYLDRQ